METTKKKRPRRKKNSNDTIVRYSYERFYRQLCLKEKRGSISDKEVGQLVGESERQIRNAKENGLDAYQADSFCARGLGILAHNVYPGFNTCPEALFAGDLHDGVTDPYELMVRAGAPLHLFFVMADCTPPQFYLFEALTKTLIANRIGS